MFPPLFKTLQASATVRSIFGQTPRVHRFGEAPQNETTPYATWLTLTTPENELSDVPGIDRHSVQIDVWSDKQNEATAAATAIRDALETIAHMTQVQQYPRDEVTRKYRVSMDFDWFHSRE